MNNTLTPLRCILWGIIWFYAPVLHAQPLQWQHSSAPEGGDVVAFSKTGGDTVYASVSYGGLYRSTDAGLRWAYTGLEGLPTRTLLCVAELGSSLFATTRSNGVYRSDNGGRSWIAANTGVEDLRTGKIFAAAGTLFVSCPTGVYRSSDRGDSWQRITNFITKDDTNYTVSKFLYKSDTLYLGFRYDIGIQYSTDKGLHWKQLTAGNIGSFVYPSYRMFIIFGSAPGSLGYSEYQREFSPTKQQWEWKYSGSPSKIQGDIAVADFDGKILSLSGSISRDSGRTWQSMVINNDDYPVADFCVIGNAILAAVPKTGVIRSTDGKNFTPSHKGLGAGYARYLFTAPQQVFLCEDTWRTTDNPNYYLYHTTDGGNDWQSFQTTFTNANQAARPLTGLYHKGYIFLSFTNGTLRSSDNGKNWDTLPARTYASLPYSGYNRSSTHLLFEKNNELYALFNDSLCSSTDAGKTWQALAPADTIFGAALIAESNKAMVCIRNKVFIKNSTTFARKAVYRSTDGGLHWQSLHIDDNISPTTIQYYSIAAVGSHIFIGTNEGLYYSTNDGEAWKKGAIGLSDADTLIRSIVSVGNSLYLSSIKGIYRSTDNGGEWRSVTGNLTMENNIPTSFNPDPTSASDDSVVYRLFGDGASLYAFAKGTGIWKSNISLTDVSEHNNLSYTVSNAVELYPQPVSSLLMYRLHSKEEKPISVTLYNRMGEEVKRYSAAEQFIGEFINVSDIPSGTYICRICTNTTAYNLPLMILR